MTRATTATAVLILLAASGAHAQDDLVDFSKQATPTCPMAGLVARPPAGWFNVPFEEPPAGHLGCQMMRTNEREELVGIIRVRSATAPAREFTGEDYDTLMANELTVVDQLGLVLADEPLYRRESVPVTGMKELRDGRAFGVLARLDGNPIPQEVHFLLVRSDTAKYVFTLITPAKSHEPELGEQNSRAFGTVLRTLQPAK